MSEIEAKNTVEDSDNSGDKRKLSPEFNLEQNNLIKKLKDSKTQPGKN